MKKIIFFAFLISVLLFNPYTMNNYIKPMFSKDTNANPSVEKDVDYTPNRFVGSLGDSLLLYDGRNLRRLDDSGKEMFSSAIRSDNFVLDVYGENIYILDRVRKMVYSVSKEGEILAQVELKQEPLDIKGITDGRFILHYITDVKVEGLLIYSKDCKLLKDINYPKRSINFIQEDSEKKGFMVSSLIRDSSMVKNNIYLYNAKLEPTLATDVEDTIFIKGRFSKENIALMDTGYVSIYDREFRPKSRISSEGGLRDLILTEDKVYTIDSAKKFRTFDLEGKLLNEEVYKEEILSVKFYLGEPLIIFRGGFVYKNILQDMPKDILDVIPLDRKIAVVFKESIKFVKVP